MADQKVTDLTNLTGPPADADEFHLVDVSDTTDDPTGSSKALTISELMKFMRPYVVVDSTGGQTMNSNTPFTVNLDSETISNTNYSLSSDVITVSLAGTYQISFGCTIDTTANVSTTRDGWESYIEYDSTGVGSSYSRVNQLTDCNYWREAADYNTTGTCSILSVAAGGLLRLRAQHTTTATAAFPLIANRTHVSIIRVG